MSVTFDLSLSAAPVPSELPHSQDPVHFLFPVVDRQTGDAECVLVSLKVTELWLHVGMLVKKLRAPRGTGSSALQELPLGLTVLLW